MITVISICFFMISFDAFHQKLKIHYGTNYMPVQSDSATLLFSFSCGDGWEIEDVISDLFDYAEQYQLDFTLGGNENILGRTYNYRWAQLNSGVIPFDSLYVKEGQSKSVKYGSDIYYRSDNQDAKALHLIYLDSDYYDSLSQPVQLYLPLHMKSEVWRSMSSGMIFISVPKNAVALHQSQLEHQFQGVVDAVSIYEPFDEYAEISQNHDGVLQIILILSVVFCAIMMVLYILNQKREITIRKLHGNHDMIIYHRLFSKLIWTMTWISIIVFGGMFWYQTREWSALGLQFLMELCWISIGFFVTLHVICWLLYVMIRSNISLRGMHHGSMRAVYYIGGFVRIGLIMICVSQLGICYGILQNDLETVNRYHKQEAVLQDKWMLNRLGNMHSSVFQTECIEAYHRLSDMGALYCSANALLNGVNEIAVNEAYVKTFLPEAIWKELSFRDQNIVLKHDASQVSDTLFEEDSAEVVIYHQNIDVPLLDFYHLDQPAELRNPLIVIVNDPSKQRYSLTIQGMEMMIPIAHDKIAHEEVLSALSDLSIAEGMSVESVEVFSRLQFEGCWKSIFKTMVQSLLYLVVIVAFTFLNLKLFYLQYGKETMIRLLYGNAFWKRYAVVFETELLVHIAAIGGYILWKGEWAQAIWIVMIFLLTAGIHFMMIRYNEQHQLLSVLKGGQA